MCYLVDKLPFLSSVEAEKRGVDEAEIRTSALSGNWAQRLQGLIFSEELNESVNS